MGKWQDYSPLQKKDTENDKNVKRKYVSEYYDGTEDGYSSHDIKITIKNDGAIYFSKENSEDFIYLYPEQVKHLKKILKVRK